MATRVRLGAAVAAGCLLLASAALAQSSYIPNTIKYSDTEKKPATGRSGEATMEAHALFRKGGTTELTVTSNGNLDKVQVKFHDQATNYSTSGSTFTTYLTGLSRREPIGVQANISGADPARTGVVSATETVKMAPELAMQYVAAPPHAVAGTPVHIVADVGEQWGDTGARTDCVLLQNGIEIDRAEDIWIDADRIVACEFATVFPPGSGTVTLQVSLRDTVPADYDTSSDTSAPFQIKVYDQLADLEQWHAYANQTRFYHRSYSRSSYHEAESIADGQRAELLFHATWRTNMPNIETLRATLRTTTDGRVISAMHDVWFDYQPMEDWGWMKQQCAVAWLGERNNYVRACYSSTPWDGEYTTFNYSQGTGDVTYVSRGWYAMYAGGPPAYVYYYNYPEVYGGMWELGDTVTFDVQISDGTNMWAANPTLNMVTTSGENEGPYTCIGEEPYRYCYQFTDRYTVKNGWASSSTGGTQ